MTAFSGYCTVKGAGVQQGTVTIKLDAADGPFSGRRTLTVKGRRKPRKDEPFKLWLIASLLAALFTPSAALAGWQSETIETHLTPPSETHSTWIYTPNSTLKDSNKRGLMVVLHGCTQTHDQLKNAGNLEEAAEDHGLVLAVPSVEPDIYPSPLVKCWDYNGTADNHGNVAEIIELTNILKKRGGIDPSHVYVVGLSSGAALALKLGCKAPDVFAGIGAIAGPSVGSNQENATEEGSQIPNTNVDNAVETCQSLAGDNYPSFATQVANIAYGTMDRNGPQQIYSCWDQNHPGQNCVASIKWSEDNIEILRKIYSTGELGNATSIQEGRGKEQIATTDGRPRLSLIVIPDVGHAFPAGTGKPNNSDNGQYIAQQGLNYPRYIAKWLTEHNIRAVPQGGPVITVNTPTVSGKDLTLTGKVSGQDQIKEVDTVLLQGDGAGNFKETETHKNVATAAGDFTDTYTNLVTGVYEVTATAMDDKNHSRSATTNEVAIGNPWKCTQSYTSNYEHVQAGRAYDKVGTAYAKGSNDKMGFDNTYYKTTLAQTKKDYFVVGSCPSRSALWSTN